MGDTCYFQMTVMKEDVKQINNLMFDSDSNFWQEKISNNDGTITLVDYEANYWMCSCHGYYDQRENLAEAGIVFLGYHGPGDTYGDASFACYNGNHIDVLAIEGEPIAVVNRDGRISEQALNHIKEYYTTRDSVEKHFKDNGGKKQ